MNVTDIARSADLNTQDRAPFPILKPTARIGLSWTAGQRGKPGINGDINSATEAVREIADPDFEVLGTNGVSSCTAYNVEGGITCTTTTADGDQVIIAPHLATSQSAWAQWTWGTDRETEWEGYFATSTSVAAICIWAGLKLTNTSVTATDDNQAFFRFEDDVNSGKLQCVYSISGVDYTFDTGLTILASTRYLLGVKIDSGRFATFYVNGAPVFRTHAALTAADLIPYIGVQAAGVAAAKAMIVYREDISRLPGA